MILRGWSGNASKWRLYLCHVWIWIGILQVDNICEWTWGRGNKTSKVICSGNCKISLILLLAFSICGKQLEKGLERMLGPVPHHSLGSERKFGLDSLGQRLKMSFFLFFFFFVSILFYFCVCHPTFKNWDISLKTPNFFWLVEI